MAEFQLEAERVVMREWHEEDIIPFQRICSDPEVIATLGPALDLSQTRSLVERMQGSQLRLGYCMWALERRGDARLIGWCGLIRGNVGPISDKLEIGWRMASDCWGHGYATEAARACLGWAFATLGDPAVWAITARINSRSRAVMQRLGMHYCSDCDFDHPGISEGESLRPHVLYRIDRNA